MDIIRETPWWVFVIFLFVVGTGINSLRTRTVSSKRLLLLPGIFTFTGIAWLGERLQGHYWLFFLWIIGMAAGSFFGWLTVRNWVIHANRRHHLITLPGSWSTLVFVILVFAIRYFFIFNYKMNPDSAHLLFAPDAFISGTITGVFIGRAYQIYQKYHSRPS